MDARPIDTIHRLRDAINRHDLEAFVACFADDFRSEQPAHPDRAFVGSAQVRTNWATFFAGVPDLAAELLRAAEQGDTVWAEWRWWGTRRDGTAVEMRGVTVYGVRGGRFVWGRLYMEETEAGGAGVYALMRRLAGQSAGEG